MATEITIEEDQQLERFLSISGTRGSASKTISVDNYPASFTVYYQIFNRDQLITDYTSIRNDTVGIPRDGKIVLFVTPGPDLVGGLGTVEVKTVVRSTGSSNTDVDFRYYDITTTPVDDAPRNINLNSNSVDEGQAGIGVGFLSTTDPDAGDFHNYQLVGDLSGKFEIVGSTLRLRSGEELDFEDQDEFVLRIRTIDSSNLAFERDIIVSVNDVIDDGVFRGGPGSDVLIGSDIPDEFYGNGGNDEIGGGRGDDILDGGDGTDVLVGGAGADTLRGGDGFDIAFYLDSPAGVTIDLENGTGVGGDAQGDTLDSIETVIGSNFNDTLIGSDAANTLIGRDGDDTFFGSTGGDILIGGNSATGDTSVSDLVDYSAAATTAEIAVNLANNSAQGLDIGTDQLFGIEDVIGSNFGDLLRGDTEDNDLTGLGGGDFILGGAGNDGIDGGAGGDIMTGEAGNDGFVFYGTDPSTGNDIITDFDQNGDDQLLFFDFGPGFDFSDFTLTVVNGNDVFIEATGWNGTALLRDATGLIDAGDFVFA